MAHLQVKRWAQYQHEDERRRSQKKETKITAIVIKTNNSNLLKWRDKKVATTISRII